jgi:PEGA domain
MLLEYFERYKKIIILMCVLLVTLLLLNFGYNLWQSKTKGTLIVEAGPPDLTMTLNGKQYGSPGKLYVSEGTYDLVFTRKEFSTYKTSVTLTKGNKETVLVALYATTAAGREYLEKHRDVQAKIEKIAGKIDAKATNELLQKYPLISVLPTTQAVGGAGKFTIDYRVNSTSNGVQSPEITVTYDGQQTKDAAIEWIKFRGFDPSKYTINYVSSLVTEDHTD